MRHRHHLDDGQVVETDCERLDDVAGVYRWSTVDVFVSLPFGEDLDDVASAVFLHRYAD